MMTTQNPLDKTVGWIEVICGSMFSGKTEELIRRLRRAQIAKQKVLVFKPKIDTRYSESIITSHSKLTIPSILIEKSSDIFNYVTDETQVIGIDEVQFLDKGIVKVCQKLADRGIRVIAAGLDQDYRGEPFDPIPQLLSIAEYITKTLAVCMVCGSPAANRTQRLIKSSERVLVGASDAYEARCRKCHKVS